MRIAVIGADGGLGGSLMALLAGRHGVEAMPVTRKDADLADGAAVTKVVSRLRPDVVVHCAAMTAVDQCETDKDLAWQINVEGTRAVADAVRGMGARLVYVSTDYVFDGAKDGLYTPDDAPRPLNVYGVTKREGEKIAIQTPGGLVIRTSWLFSWRGKSFARTVLELARKQSEIKMVNDQTGAPTYSKDLAAAILVCIEKNANGILHVANAGACTWHEYAKKVLTCKGIAGVTVTPITSDELNRPARRPKNSRLDCSAYAALAGRPLRPWDRALEEMLETL